MSEDSIYRLFPFAALLQACIAFQKYSNIFNSDMLKAVLTDIIDNKIEMCFFGATLSYSVVQEKYISVNLNTIMKYMKATAVSWLHNHIPLIDALPQYYKHALGIGPSNAVYYLIDRKEYIIGCIQFANSSLESPPSCSIKSNSNPNRISVTLSHPIPEQTYSSLLLLLHDEITSFSVVSTSWLQLQQLEQKLYGNRNSKQVVDFNTEALAQKLARIFVQDGVLVPRYYNVYRKKPENDIYWKWSPLVISSEITSLQSLLHVICNHLKKEPSAFIFLNPVNSVQFPNYRTLITHPMDLSTISKRVSSDYYTTYSTFHRDMLQLFWNGCTFNPCHDIWYQQCVVLKICYMNIYEQIVASGLDKLWMEQLESNHEVIIKGLKQRGSYQIHYFTDASTKEIKMLAQNEENCENFRQVFFKNSYDVPCYPILRYSVYQVGIDYNANSNDEISLKRGMLVYLLSRLSNGMVEVMQLDLHILGLCPLYCLEEISNNGQILKRICNEDDIDSISIRKRGKLLDVPKVQQVPKDFQFPVQTHYTEYSI